MASEHPFTVLGLEPTEVMAEVKRAYFEALARHPPHADPEGFRRVRTAYEALMAPGGLKAAFASAPLDVAALAEAASREWEAPVAQAVAALRDARASAGGLEQFVAAYSALSYEDALRLATTRT